MCLELQGGKFMFKLALNAGHGLYTAGKRCMKKLDPNETREWSLNNRICDKIEEKLKIYKDIEILRLDDTTGKTDISLKRRTDSANNFKADFYLSIHHNAGVNGGSGGGLETYIHTNASDKSTKWQKELYKNLIKNTNLLGNRSNGMRKANFHECRESKMPCVLIECGFMDSKTDVPIILSEEFANQVATACTEVIVEKANLNVDRQPKKENKVLLWQKAAIKDGFKFTKYGADGNWGSECESVAKKAVCKKRVTYKYKNLTKIVQETVGVTTDGKFGSKTKEAVEIYQKKNKLTVDGCVGSNTWKKILGVK